MMKTWSQLTDDERDVVEAEMVRCGGKSKNGVAGWYMNQRLRVSEGLQHKMFITKPIPRPTARGKTPRARIAYSGISVADAVPEPEPLDAFSDIIPERMFG